LLHKHALNAQLEEIGSADGDVADRDVDLERENYLDSVLQDARERGDFAKARAIAAKILEPGARDRALTEIIEAEMRQAEVAGRYADVTRLASQITDRDARADALAGLASGHFRGARRTRALQLYDDAYRLLTSGGTMLPTRGIPILLAYARAVRTVTPERSFELVRDAIAVANRSDPYECCRSHGDLACATDFSEPLAELALVDLERAVGLAKSIEDPYNSISALMAIGLAAAQAEPGRDARKSRPLTLHRARPR
jgi:hypothetical protein